MSTIYLDNNATTRPADEVVAAMQQALAESGNPSSLHLVGQAARRRLELAREQVAALVGAKPREVVFTSGGTEADNLAILGTLAAHPTRKHFVTTAVEHSAVIQLAARLERHGYRVTYVGVDRAGRPDLDAFADALTDDTALASVMWANNETGVVHPVEQVARIAESRRIPLHVDAVQAVGKLPIDIAAGPIALLSLSAHKFHGPQGAGALIVRRGTRLMSMLVGGHQERDLRPGTENVPAIVGLGVAAELLLRQPPDVGHRVAALRDRLEEGVLSRIEGTSVNGDRQRRVCNTTNISFDALAAEAILIAMSEAGLCASSGAACSSGSLEPSHVLKAMGIDERAGHGAIRFSLSRYTTESEIDATLQRLPAIIARLASLAPTAV